MCEWMRRTALALTIALVLFLWFSFADVVGAKSGLKFKDLWEAGWVCWTFLIVGALIIMLQLIPATIVLFSYVGVAHKSIPVKKEETAKKREWEPQEGDSSGM